MGCRICTSFAKRVFRRYKHRAYCYLLLSPNKTDPGSGGQAAQGDGGAKCVAGGGGSHLRRAFLELRGAGNILGPEQSGHIAAVGYEMYCQLLEEAVKRIKNEPIVKPKEINVIGLGDGCLPEVVCGFSGKTADVIFIGGCRGPRAWRGWRRFRRILRMRLGRCPRPYRCCLGWRRSRFWRSSGRFCRSAKPPDVVFKIEDLTKLGPLMGKGVGGAGSVRIADEKTIHLRLPTSYLEPETMVNVLRNLLNPNAPKVEVKKPVAAPQPQRPAPSIRRRL